MWMVDIGEIGDEGCGYGLAYEALAYPPRAQERVGRMAGTFAFTLFRLAWVDIG